MASDRFDFKQFSIYQDQCAMKVGTDGVLLGAWAGQGTLGGAMIDVGTGTGIIALMLAQRGSVALGSQSTGMHIDAIEIDINAARQAAENVAHSPWKDSITVHAISLQDFAQDLDANRKYDLIVSNPPFYNATLKPEDEGRAMARHKDALPIEEIARFAKRHLSPTGRLALIFPADYDTEVTTAAVLNGLYPSRVCHVLTKEGKTCKRRMKEFVLNLVETHTETLCIRNSEGHYTEEYKRLTDDFYLHLTD